MKVSVSYNFIFDPSESWASTSEFEAFLARALRDDGMSAERVRTDIEDFDAPVNTFIVHKVEEPILGGTVSLKGKGGK